MEDCPYNRSGSPGTNRESYQKAKANKKHTEPIICRDLA